MPNTRRLLRREITFESAQEEESNVLHQLDYYDQQTRFFSHLDANRSWMKEVVAHHLGLSSSTVCHVVETRDWLHGSFNVCIPVIVRSRNGKHGNEKRVLIRFPLPYRVGEAFRPGNSDEKIQCEAGTYTWLQENCPDVPIPQLYGFSLSTGESFTLLENLPLFTRWIQSLRRFLLPLLRQPVPSNYVRGRATTIPNAVGTGYLLIEYIEETRGTMLSNTWTNGRHDDRLRKNLFRDLSRIILSMSRVALPRIGSFIIDEDGFLKLINRPLTSELQQMENGKIPTDISRDCTYSTVDSYLVDFLRLHDNRFRYQPNAVNNLGDCVHQLSTLTAMRSVFQSLFQRKFCRGPFFYCLTDLHQSNIFVDADWHITCLVDLEWACSRPLEMVHTPYWLTNKGVDEIVPEEYDETRREFVTILASEEEDLGSTTLKKDTPLSLASIMEQGWSTGTFWYALALSSPSGLFNIFKQHIRPLFCKDYIEEFNLIMPFFWERNVARIAGCKLAEKEQYDKELEQAFRNDPA